jgi:hypothetical protein
VQFRKGDKEKNEFGITRRRCVVDKETNKDEKKIFFLNPGEDQFAGLIFRPRVKDLVIRLH